jgi:4-amino-4-deoxy-L-arabinose transferase-like glycosyltransferase
MSDRKLHALGQRVAVSTGLFVLALIPRALALNAFLTPDERRWLGRSVKFLAALLYQDWAGTLRTGHPGVTTMWTAVAGLTSKYLFGAWSDGLSVSQASLLEFQQGVPTDAVSLDYLAAIRFPTVLLTSVFVVVFYFLVGKLLGKKVALLSAVLVALDPFYLAHSRLLHHDALVATFMSLSLLSFLVYLSQTRARVYLVLSGLSAGLAFLSKATSLFLVPFMGLLAWMAYLEQGAASPQPRWREGQRWLGRLLVWGLIAGLTFVALWPAMWVEPAKALGEVWEKSTSAAATDVHTQGDFFLGRPTLDAKILFYPVTFLLRTTPLSLAGTALAVYFLVKRYRPSRDSAAQTQKHWRGYFEQDSLDPQVRFRSRNLTSLLLYMFLFTAFISLGGIKYDRYLLPIYPALGILAAEGLCQVVLWAKPKESVWMSRTFGLDRPQKLAADLAIRCQPAGFGNPAGASCGPLRLERPWTLLAVALALQAGFALPHYPYFLTYYNPAFGGGWLAPQVMLVGWGEGLDQAARYLNNRDDPVKVQTATWYDSEFAPFYPGETLPLREVDAGNVIPWLLSDYVVSYLPQVQSNAPDEATVRYFRSLEPEHIIHLKGMDYAWVYRTPKALPDEVIPALHARKVPFGSSILFLGYDVDKAQGNADKLLVTLYWHCLHPMEQNYRVWLKLVNGVYHVWGQEDNIPVGGRFPTHIWREGTVLRDEHELEILPGTPPGLYHIEVGLYDPQRQESLEPDDNGLLLGPVEVTREEPSALTALDIQHPLAVSLADQILLLGYNIESGFRPGDGIHLILFWQCLEELDRDYTVFTHLVDKEGKFWGQKDNEPADGFYPTGQWKVGEIVRDQYDITISPKAPPGEYRLEVGMYLAETGERLPVLGKGVDQTRRTILLSPVQVVER